MSEREICEEELFALLRHEATWRQHNKFYEMYPDEGVFSRDKYEKHLRFFELGVQFRERCFMGGNGTGKTWGVSAYEATCHLTGDYPAWWKGLRFNGPISAWACGDTRETVRDIVQAKMIGDVAQGGEALLGTGMIPRSMIAGPPRYVPNTNRGCDFIPIKHISGGVSTLGFKAYEQGRKAFQGTEKHLILLDEEPPEDIYLECLMRGRTVDGRTLLTFTPLSGFTDVVKGFLEHEKATEKGASKVLVTCGWDDVPHLDEKWKNETMAATPPHLRDARRLGIPTAGVGKVYPIPEEEFVVTPFRLPPHFRRVFGLDTGWKNTAAVWVAYDKDEDMAYVYSDYKRGELPVDVHAAAMKARGPWIPCKGDAAARGVEGAKTIELYKAQGVKVSLPNKAVDAGIQSVFSRLSTGKLKIFSTCQRLLEEMRMYRYDENQKVVKENDHCCDALRYAIFDGLKIATTERTHAFDIPEVRFG